MSLSNTLRLKQIEGKSKACVFCTAMEVVEMTVCVDTCHAETRKERTKIALKARKTLGRRLDEAIVPAMTFQHPELRPAVAEVEVRAERAGDRVQSLIALYSSAKGQLNERAPRKDTRQIRQRLAALSDRLDSADLELAQIAGESFDLEERVGLLCSQEDDSRSIQRLSAELKPVKTELQKLKGDAMKLELDLGMLKVNVGKRTREQGNRRPYRADKWIFELESQRKDLSRENDNTKARIREREEQLRTLGSQLEMSKTLLTTLSSDFATVTILQSSIEGINPAILLCITSQVFGPYKRINKFKRETKEKYDTLRVQLGTLKRK